MNKHLRQTLIALLYDEDGISKAGYEQLVELNRSLCTIYVVAGSNQDIFNLAETSNGTGRYFLPEDHGLVP